MRSCSVIVSEMGLIVHIPWSGVALGVIVGLILSLLIDIVSETMKPIIPDWGRVPQEYDFVAFYAGSKGVWKAILFLIFGFNTPVIEEISFRGIIHSVLRRAFLIPATLLLSSSETGYDVMAKARRQSERGQVF